MKYKVHLLAAILVLLCSCRHALRVDKALVAEAEQAPAMKGIPYKADLAQTHIEWIGTSPVNKHHGAFMLREGMLGVEGGAVTGGRFVVDMKTLCPDDQDSAGNAMLGAHLLGSDFFDANIYPTAVFEITAVRAGVAKGMEASPDATHTVTGNLMIKDITKSITFPARIRVREEQVTADASFSIDRDHWGISYKSEGSIKDRLIRSQVNIQIHLVAAR